ncbi:uncharacterized protein LOC124909955 [Impatiens glandulifera]|uniref:uncharacterized protein LOC124909955 n=1 Tax=Impatiens glandulifera TaxID=253017 RepID=UPI001FB144CF|nr:uncharacterized protein LOC124909955 [Impatiens glandulifera]
MASLTPGVLSKLLENVGNKEVKVAGEHRTALLQVIGIVPALVGGDPWESRGFYLRVSDSVHSAYVAISDDETELILTDKIQLGQFIYVDRFDRGPAVPVLRGIRPVSKRRACIGEPKDLISSDLLPIRTRVSENVTSRAKGINTMRKSNGAGGMLKRDSAEVMEPRRLSLDSARRGWDRSPVHRNSVVVPAASVSKTKEEPSGSSIKKSSSSERDYSVSKPPNPANSPAKTSNGPAKLTGKQAMGKKKPDNGISGHLVKVAPVNFRSWCAPKVAWDSLPRTIRDHGKETLRHRNSAFLAAIHALTESSAADAVLRCMSTFDELCVASRKDPPGSVVERFLNLHLAIEKSATTADSLLNRKLSLSQACENLPDKNAISWIQAAVESDLSKISLYRKDDKGVSEGDNGHVIILEKGVKKETAGESSSNNKRHNSSMLKKPECLEKHDLSNGNTNNNNAMKDIANLSQKLILSSRSWFLRYLEDLFGSGESGLEMGGLLMQLRKVDKWLEGIVGNEEETDEKIEKLRKTLYGLLLQHVDSASLQ